MTAWDDMVLVGRVARPHGIRGQVVVNPETDFVEDRFVPGAVFWTRSPRGDEQLVVASARVQNGRPVLAFDGIATVEDAGRLAGLELRIPEDSLQALEDGAYYQHQLVGCVVVTADGRTLGAVTRVDGGIAGSLLAVNGPRGEILVPFAADICVQVDVAGRTITIAPPEGLLELNETREVRHRHHLSPDDRRRPR